jgi:hypothetical protein
MGLDFTNEEFKKLSSRDQFTLFTVDFDRYANVEAYNKLPGYLQSEIYIKNPDWVISSVGQKPRLNQSDLVGIARNNPTFVDKYVVDELENHSTTELFWTHMFKHKPVVYKNLFIKNIHTVSNKSDLRQIFRNSPGLITRLTPEIMDRGKLTIKEWVLLIKNLVDKKHKDLAGWSMSPEMVDALRFDLTVEVMNGTSRSTSHLKSALNSVLKEKQATEIESETVS